MSDRLANSSHADDVRYLVHQQTELKAYRDNGGVLMKSGRGIYVIDESGDEYLDAMAGLWCASLGFSEPRLAEAAARQLNTLPYYHMFFDKGHLPSVALGKALLSIAPQPMAKTILQCSGSEANDTAIKLVWYYHNSIGQPHKKKIIARERSYHGTTLATSGLSGLAHMKMGFDSPLPIFRHTENPNYYRFHHDGETEEQFADRMAESLEALILREGPETIAAFFGEPVQGGGGAITPPRTYWEKIQRVLKRYDILFVVDEVISGFGRTGHMWGSQTYDLQPDMLACAKALSSGYQPISALMMSDKVYQALEDLSAANGAFGHGFTYGGHPVACAVALETLNIYAERDIVGQVRRRSPRLLGGLESLRDHDLVGDVRGIGLFAGVELMMDKKSRTPWPLGKKAALTVQTCASKRGLIIRAIGDRIAFCPPLIISDEEIDIVCARFKTALDDAWKILSSES